MVLISMVSTLVLFAIVFGVLWHYRTRILADLAQVVTLQQQSVPAIVSPEMIQPQIVPEVTTVAATIEPVIEKDLSASEVVTKVNKSVVSITVSAMVTRYNFFTGQQQSALTTVSSGSGFFVSKEGLVLTNRHVVDVANAAFTVTTSTGKEYLATVVAKDSVLDVAILKLVDAGRADFPAMVLGDSDTLSPGQSVVAIGYVLGQFKNSVSVGVISGLSRSLDASGANGRAEHLDQVIQTDAAINPGNSGGPLLNLRGEVIGVNVATAEAVQSVGFALPINSVKTVIASVKKTGTIVRPYVGVYYMDINEQVQVNYNLPVATGTYIKKVDGGTAVIPGSPAATAGMRDGDIITAIDGVKLTDNTNFASVIRQKTVGKKVQFSILRGAEKKTVSVLLEAAK